MLIVKKKNAYLSFYHSSSLLEAPPSKIRHALWLVSLPSVLWLALSMCSEMSRPIHNRILLY